MPSRRVVVEADTGPDCITRLKDGKKAANLTGVTGVVCRFKREGEDAILINCTVDLPPTDGLVRFPWTVNTRIPGKVLANWTVTYENGQTQTFPSQDPLEIFIRRQLR